MISKEKYLQIRKVLAWSTDHKMKKIGDLKKRLFKLTVESALLYSCETLTVWIYDGWVDGWMLNTYVGHHTKYWMETKLTNKKNLLNQGD